MQGLPYPAIQLHSQTNDLIIFSGPYEISKLEGKPEGGGFKPSS
ncbi:hypothetical protein J2Z22_002811 [Paenibacillus forsythiae]|uniref:Uncharacterized protein n=1 Tax=Paenibacillus forsythiae TaxID=365616 RepID=A0ABU3HC43_9BACL|nr:hypothetical protein [Paenibacillus forsythiae]MDT3427260.1 hypothetical protein [Paenibacillus forsythiae]